MLTRGWITKHTGGWLSARHGRGTLGLWLAPALLSCLASAALAQGTAFTYQGRLNSNTNPVSGNYDFRFRLSTDPNGNNVSAPVLVTNLPVANGLFTALMDFGVGPFTGSNLWLQIEVRTNGASAYFLLSPLQALTPAPYAITAGNVVSSGLSGAYLNAVSFSNAANSFVGSYAGNGGGLTNLNASQLTGPLPATALSGAWKISGNAGTSAGTNFIGTTDNQPLEFKVGGERTLRLEPVSTATNYFGVAGSVIYSNAPNVIGGAPVNGVDPGVFGAVIGGGGMDGGYLNTGTGYTNVGTFPNHVSAYFSTIAGGVTNVIQTNAAQSFIGGGYGNLIQASSVNCAIGGGVDNVIQAGANSCAIAGGQINAIGSNTSYSFIGGGGNNTNAGDEATISGGVLNTVSANADESTIAGGSFNQVESGGFGSAIGGGSDNVVNGTYATIPGGNDNFALGNYSFAAGRDAYAQQAGSFVWNDSRGIIFSDAQSNQFLINAGGGVGIGTSTTPPGGLHVHTGGLAVSGASSPNYGATAGVFIENDGAFGAVYAFDYSAFAPLPLALNSPGGDVGIGRVPTANALEVEGNASKTTAGSWAANSDARIKTDVRSLSHALEKLDQVRPVEFRYTPEYRAKHPSIEDHPYVNVIAQEFQKAFPDSVKSSGEQLPNGDSILQVDTYPLTIYSVAAIQDLHRQLEQQQAEIRSLQESVAELKTLLNRSLADRVADARPTSDKP